MGSTGSVGPAELLSCRRRELDSSGSLGAVGELSSARDVVAGSRGVVEVSPPPQFPSGSATRARPQTPTTSRLISTWTSRVALLIRQRRSLAVAARVQRLPPAG